RSHSVDADDIVATLTEECLRHGGEARISKVALEAIRGAARVLNIAWVEDALAAPARIICPRSTYCPRAEHCDGAGVSRACEIIDVRKEIIRKRRGGAAVCRRGNPPKLRNHARPRRGARE